MRNQGALLLAKSGKTHRSIAEKVGVVRTSVTQWMSGDTTPLPAKRVLLHEYYGIPIETWDQDIVPSVRPSEIRVSARGTVDVYTKAERLEGLVEDIMTSIETDTELTATEKARALQACGQTLRNVAYLTGHDLNVRMFHTPLWRRVEHALVVALEGHPEASGAVLGAIAALRDEVAKDR